MYTSKDFENLPFNVFKLKDTQDVFSVFPELDIYPEFKRQIEAVSTTKVIRYIGFLYQEQTPLRIIDNFVKRKYEAANLSGFPRNEGVKFRKPYQDIVDGKNSIVNAMIIRFCRMQRSPDFSELMVYMDVFYRELENLTNEEDVANRTKIMLNIDKSKSKINSLTLSLLGGDTGRQLTLDLMDEMETEKLGLRPEIIATKIRDGKHPFDGYNPYEQRRSLAEV